MGRIRKFLRDTPLGWPIIVVIVVSVTVVSMLKESLGYKKVVGKNELTELLAGSTLQGDGFWFRYDSDGRATGYVGETREQGQWFTTEQYYCEQWRNWAEGETVCWSVESNGKLIKRTGIRNRPESDKPTINTMQLSRHTKTDSP